MKKTIIILASVLLAAAVVIWYGLEKAEAPTGGDTGSEEDESGLEGTEAGSLEMNTWVWQYTDLQSGDRVEAPAGDRFVLSFDGAGHMSSLTDCNSIGGNYVVDGEVLSIGQMVSTKMYCEGSMEGPYAEHLGLVNSFGIEGDTLQLHLNRDYGLMVFKKQ